jgi:hypothetical protein
MLCLPIPYLAKSSHRYSAYHRDDESSAVNGLGTGQAPALALVSGKEIVVDHDTDDASQCQLHRSQVQPVLLR